MRGRRDQEPWQDPAVKPNDKRRDGQRCSIITITDNRRARVTNSDRSVLVAQAATAEAEVETSREQRMRVRVARLELKCFLQQGYRSCCPRPASTCGRTAVP